MARTNASKREYVWIDTDIRKTEAFKSIGLTAFGLWIRLPFLVDDNHALPNLITIAKDSHVTLAEAAEAIGELERAGLIDVLPTGFRMTPFSQQYYALTEPTEDEE